MKDRIRKGTGLALLALCMLAAPLVSGAEEGVISQITLEVETDIRIGAECSIRDFELTLESPDCEVKEVELLNTNAVWGNADVPRLLVYLRADSGYRFSVTKSGIHITGAECEYGHWDENIYMYVLQLRFPALSDQVGEIGEAGWRLPSAAVWSPAPNVAYYELQLYYGGEKQGSVVKTTAAEYDLGSRMRKEGTYYYQVRAVNRRDQKIKSSWKESAAMAVDAAAAAQNRANFPPPSGSGPLAASGAEEPPYYQDMYGWIAEGSRWWYRNADGSYTVSDWQYIDGSWYYFDSKGYMVTGWIDWNDKSYYCDPESGAMLVNTIVPDGLGLRVDSSGALIE